MTLFGANRWTAVLSFRFEGREKLLVKRRELITTPHAPHRIM
jgi:hypothetical protein